jgi:hypothetical protein
MIGLLIRAYSAWPLRSHCGNGRHVALCRIFDPALVIFAPDRRCNKPARPTLP